MSKTGKAPAFDKETEEDPWQEQNAPHAARDKAPNKGKPTPAAKHDPQKQHDRISHHADHGRTHLPSHVKKGGGSGSRGDSMGKGWDGDEKAGERERVDEMEPLALDPRDPGEFAPPGVDE